MVYAKVQRNNGYIFMYLMSIYVHICIYSGLLFGIWLYRKELISCHSSGKTILKRQYIYLCAPQYKYFLKRILGGLD